MSSVLPDEGTLGAIAFQNETLPPFPDNISSAPILPSEEEGGEAKEYFEDIVDPALRDMADEDMSSLMQVMTPSSPYDRGHGQVEENDNRPSSSSKSDRTPKKQQSVSQKKMTLSAPKNGASRKSSTAHKKQPQPASSNPPSTKRRQALENLQTTTTDSQTTVSPTIPVSSTPRAKKTATPLSARSQAAAVQQMAAPPPKKNTTKSCLSAFMHLYQPHMTSGEQIALIKKYERDEAGLWRKLEAHFGPGAVPKRLLDPIEYNKGSMKIRLVLKCINGMDDYRKVQSLMQKHCAEIDTRETVFRNTQVVDLLKTLELRWATVNDHLNKTCNKILALFAVTSAVPLPHKTLVRDEIVDGCLEYAWVEPEISEESMNQTFMDASVWENGHSLSGFSPVVQRGKCAAKRQRRIQPIQLDQACVELNDHT